MGRSKLWNSRNAVPEKSADQEKTAGNFRIPITRGLSVEPAKIEELARIDGKIHRSNKIQNSC